MCHFLGTSSRKGQRRRFEIGERRMTSVVRDMLVHQAPKPFDRIQMRAVGRNEVELDSAPPPRQPSLHQIGVVVAGVVHKPVDQPLARISIALACIMPTTPKRT